MPTNTIASQNSDNDILSRFAGTVNDDALKEIEEKDTPKEPVQAGKDTYADARESIRAERQKLEAALTEAEQEAARIRSELNALGEKEKEIVHAEERAAHEHKIAAEIKHLEAILNRHRKVTAEAEARLAQLRSATSGKYQNTVRAKAVADFNSTPAEEKEKEETEEVAEVKPVTEATAPVGLAAPTRGEIPAVKPAEVAAEKQAPTAEEKPVVALEPITPDNDLPRPVAFRVEEPKNQESDPLKGLTPEQAMLYKTAKPMIASLAGPDTLSAIN